MAGHLLEHRRLMARYACRKEDGVLTGAINFHADAFDFAEIFVILISFAGPGCRENTIFTA